MTIKSPYVLRLLYTLLLSHSLHAAPTRNEIPDLTRAEAASKIDRKHSTYNLGPTGLRGYIHVSRRPGDGANGTMTGESRQILVTVASTPADKVLQVDDVILGAAWGTSGKAVPSFSFDARKAFGNAITEAEKKRNAGIIRIKRWRAGKVADVSFKIPVMGSYADSAPYDCAKSKSILERARKHYVDKLRVNPDFLSRGSRWASPVHALALLSAVRPEDRDYGMVQSRIMEYARGISKPSFTPNDGCMWTIGHQGLFLAEYYLSSSDAEVLSGIRAYLEKLVNSMSSYGTCNHRPALPRMDGSGRYSVRGYGAVNSAAITANLAIVMLKKALLQAGDEIKPEVDIAIERAANFYSWYVNKGSIPYGEHHPYLEGHASNGKNGSSAVLFSQIEGRETECEYFTRTSVASFNSREYGHTGQGFSYLWEGMAANIGGPYAIASYFKPLRWHLDLSRRTDGSFAYDGQEQYGGGGTDDGTYLGNSSYFDLEATAIYLLTHSLPCQRLLITGKKSNPAHKLTKKKVDNAVYAGNFTMKKDKIPIEELFNGLREYDPVVRKESALELSKRQLDEAEVSTLRSMLAHSDANARRSACEALSQMKDASSIPQIVRLLDKVVEQDPWVRASAAKAMRVFGDMAKTEVPTMLRAFAVNASDPDKIDWNDPLQAGNGELAFSLFDSQPGTNHFTFKDAVADAEKGLLHPALRTAIRHPDSAVRGISSRFVYNKASKEDVMAMPNEMFELILNDTQCDRMWSDEGRGYGVKTLAKHRFQELLPVAVKMSARTQEFWHDRTSDAAIRTIASFGDKARWALPALRNSLSDWDPKTSHQHKLLLETIAAVESATTAPEFGSLKATAETRVLSTAINAPLTLSVSGKSPRGHEVSFEIITSPAHGTLSGNAPNLTYTPDHGYSGPDHFTYTAKDTLTNSEPAAIGIIVGSAGKGLTAEYFSDSEFKTLNLTRVDAQVDFDWSITSPDSSIRKENFGVKWTGQLLIPETASYIFSTLSTDTVVLYIDARKVIDHQGAQPTRWLDGKPIDLKQGQLLEIGLAYGHATGPAMPKLRWSGPGIAGRAGSIIPKEYLYHTHTEQ